ncbi:hypothetical protein [Stenoxybacter acetivorans]|uniref:hypothetical protein n=1 Tax=Stenoxybacter acetivorans TaxID=422441 RepID=UPI00056C44F6|nr:hypothetical protein [Stenoxybacter acetivorans]
MIEQSDFNIGDLSDNDAATINNYAAVFQNFEYLVNQINSNPPQSVLTYILTLQNLQKTLERVFKIDIRAENIKKQKEINKNLTSMEAKLKGCEERFASLESMLIRIEKANKAAEELPIDLEELAKARTEIAEIADEVKRDQSEITQIKEDSNEIDRKLKGINESAELTLEKCKNPCSKKILNKII